MDEQHAWRPPNRFKKRRMFTRDANGQFTHHVFQFGSLPTELQVIILLKAAVTRRLLSKSFEEVFETFGSVSPVWKEMIDCAWFEEKVKQQAIQKG